MIGLLRHQRKNTCWALSPLVSQWPISVAVRALLEKRPLPFSLSDYVLTHSLNVAPFLLVPHIPIALFSTVWPYLSTATAMASALVQIIDSRPLYLHHLIPNVTDLYNYVCTNWIEVYRLWDERREAWLSRTRWSVVISKAQLSRQRKGLEVPVCRHSLRFSGKSNFGLQCEVPNFLSSL